MYKEQCNNLIKKQSNKNMALNFLKGCACFCILYMHTSYDSLFSSVISCLSRFAVLIFFMISGYYCFNSDKKVVAAKLPRKIKHIGMLCLVSTFIHFVWDGILSKLLYGGEVDIIAFIEQCFSWKNLFRFLMFNQLPFGGILWFLFALLYCYLIFWVINKFNWYKAAYVLIPVLIVIHIMSRGYIQYNGLVDEVINIDYYRNFLFMGFPFFMLGNFIHKYEEKIINKFSDRKLIVLIGVGLALSCIERFIVVLELFWGTVIATFCMFIFAIKNPEKKIIPIIATIGEKYSMPIYILHTIVSSILFVIKKSIGIEYNVILAVLNPLIIYLLIPLVIFGFEYVYNLINHMQHKKSH